MATTIDFINAMEEVYKNHGVYIGTANGELTLSLTIGQIFKMEENYGRRDKDGNPLWYADAGRDLEYLAKCRRNKYDMDKSRAGDCSGIIVGVLRDLGVIKPTADYNAKTFQKLAAAVPLSALKPGDLVFDKTSEAGHVGVYIGDGKVIESRGRDYGVVKRPTAEGGWKAAGRLSWFSDVVPPLTRNLKYIEGDLMKGEDVKQCQEQLLRKGYTPGTPDGVFGIKTKNAVIAFQKDNKLEVDGVVGQNTWKALFS